MTQSQIAKKAVRTRKARQAFREEFGQETYTIVDGLVNGLSTKDIARILRTSVGRVAAIKANLTRNTYAPFVTSNGRGTARLG